MFGGKNSLYRKTRSRIKNYLLSKTPIFNIYKPNITLRMANSRCAISKQSQFVYFRIPKAANSTVISTLYFAENGEIADSFDAINTIKKSYFTPGNLNMDELEFVLSDYWKFTLVRNPYDRILSAYLDKIVRNRPQKEWAEIYFGKYKDSITFDEFLDYLEFGNGVYDDPHWALQTDLIFMPLNEIDFVGRFENFENDIAIIAKNIFGREVDAVNWNPHSTESDSRRCEYLTVDRIRRIYRIYQKDFELLKYSKKI